LRKPNLDPNLGLIRPTDPNLELVNPSDPDGMLIHGSDAVKRNLTFSLEGLMRAPALALSAGGLIIIACALLPGLARAQSKPAPPAEAAIASPIGKVVAAKGTVSVEHVSAVVVQASVGGGGQTKVGDLVYKGDVVSTGADSSVGINFSDGTAFNLSSNARMELNEFVYDPKGKSNSTLFSLSKGTFTFIAGKVAKTGDMKIDTPVATMGIRGTTPHVEIRDDGTVAFSTLIEDKKAIAKAIEKIEKSVGPAEPVKKQRQTKSEEPAATPSTSTPSTPSTPSVATPVTTPVQQNKKSDSKTAKKPDSSYDINVGYKICRGC
jgi:hypothetical protein